MEIIDGRLTAKQKVGSIFEGYGKTDIEDLAVVAPAKLAKSPNLTFYVDAIRGGWSCERLEIYAAKAFGEQISRVTFWKLSQLIPLNEKAEPTYRQSILKDVDLKIDAINELEALVMLQIRRVSDAAAFERQLAVGKGAGVIPLKNTQEEIALLHGMLKDLVNMQVRLGVSDYGRPGVIDVGVGSGALQASPLEMKVIELKSVLTPGQLDKFISMSEELQASIYALSVDVVDEHIIGVTEQVSIMVQKSTCAV